MSDIDCLMQDLVGWKIVRKQPKRISGVYVLCTIKNNKPEALYVGQSNDVHYRIKSHTQIPWTYYKYLETDNQETKADLEHQLILRYQPLYNLLQRRSLLPSAVNTADRLTYIGKHAVKRYRAEAEIIKAHGLLSCRQIQTLLYKQYNIIVNHNTINSDLKTKKYTPYL